MPKRRTGTIKLNALHTRQLATLRRERTAETQRVAREAKSLVASARKDITTAKRAVATELARTARRGKRRIAEVERELVNARKAASRSSIKRAQAQTTRYYDKRIEEFTAFPRTMQQQAQTLLNSRAWQSDNGFTGRALTAWNAMKNARVVGLRRIVAGEKITAAEANAQRVACPQNYGTGGTTEGATWNSQAHRVISNWQQYTS